MILFNRIKFKRRVILSIKGENKEDDMYEYLIISSLWKYSYREKYFIC